MGGKVLPFLASVLMLLPQHQPLLRDLYTPIGAALAWALGATQDAGCPHGDLGPGARD